MNHLRELLERDIALVFHLPELADATALELHHEFRSLARQAVCFFIGDVERLGGLTAMNEISLHLPYPTCWFEATANEGGGQPALLMGCLAHTKGDGTIRLYLYARTGTRWVIAAVAEMGNLWVNEVLVLPKTEQAAAKVLCMRDLLCVFLTAMNCTNVRRYEQHPSAKLQKSRAKRGKAPLFSYWTLQLNGRSDRGNHKGGTHDSPRVHLRRGHPRQFAPGKWTWVQPCAVGNKAAGMVHKDYRAGGGMLPPE